MSGALHRSKQIHVPTLFSIPLVSEPDLRKRFPLAGDIEDRWRKKKPSKETGKRERTALWGRASATG